MAHRGWTTKSNLRFSAIDVLSMFQATDIPVFKTLHGWEVAFGNYWSYDADYARKLFIKAYDRVL